MYYNSLKKKKNKCQDVINIIVLIKTAHKCAATLTVNVQIKTRGTGVNFYAFNTTNSKQLNENL